MIGQQMRMQNNTSSGIFVPLCLSKMFEDIVREFCEIIEFDKEINIEISGKTVARIDNLVESIQGETPTFLKVCLFTCKNK
jgi:hypothetical protein